MSIFSEDYTLKHINELLSSEISKYRILGDLPLELQDLLDYRGSIEEKLELQ